MTTAEALLINVIYSINYMILTQTVVFSDWDREIISTVQITLILKEH